MKSSLTVFARYAGLAGLPAFFPAFARAAWLEILPEFIPFKYNSFSANAACQSYFATQAVQAQVARAAGNGTITRLPPIHTFQSVTDYTVSTQAVVSGQYARLPANGSELTLFDLKRVIRPGPLVDRSRETIVERLPPAAPRVQDDARHQCRLVLAGGRRTLDRGRRSDEGRTWARPRLPARRVLPVPRRDSVPGDGPTLRVTPRSPGELRSPPRNPDAPR